MMYKIIAISKKQIDHMVLVNLGKQGLDENSLPFGYATVDKSFKQGDIVYRVSIDSATSDNHWKAFQINVGKHVIDSVIEGVNHDCNPSVYFEPEFSEEGAMIAVNVMARRDISPIQKRTLDNMNDVITFNYLTNEVAMDADFSCSCQTCTKSEKQSARIHGMSDMTFVNLVKLLKDQLPEDKQKWMPHVMLHLQDRSADIIKQFFKGAR
jgi:hypothetical protein